MRLLITQNMLYDAQTYLANIEEPDTAEDWAAFDAKDFRDIIFPIDYTTKSPFIDNDECTKFWEYADKVLQPSATVEDVYYLIDVLEEEISDNVRNLRSKNKLMKLSLEENCELICEGIHKEYEC